MISSLYCPRSSIAAVAVVLFFYAPRLQAQHDGAGTTAFPFLNVNYDARTVALAGASVAMPGDLCGVLSNPAVIGFIREQQTYIGYRSVLGGLYGAPLAYARPEKARGVFAITMVGLTSGKIAGTDIGNDGAPISTGGFARPDYIAGNISWGTMLNAFSAVGVTFKGAYNYLGSPQEHFSADGFAIDGGIQFRSINSRLMYGLAIRNFGMLRSGYTDEDNYKLPATVELGFSYVPRNIETLRLAFDMNKKRDDYLLFEPGFELEAIRGQLVVRAGYGFSYPDFQAAVKVLKGEPEKEYIKTNRSTLCLGAGFLTRLAERSVKIDTAFEFSDGGIVAPAFVVSMLVGL